MAYSSLKPDRRDLRGPFALPAAGHLQFDNYGRAWREVRYCDYFLNSVLVTTVSVAAIVLLGRHGGVCAESILPSGRSRGLLAVPGRPDDSGAISHGAAFTLNCAGWVCSIHAPD